MLIEYGKLMKYRPTPSANSYCYDGPLALRQFGPDPNDAADVLETYPWCAPVKLTSRLSTVAASCSRLHLQASIMRKAGQCGAWDHE